MSKATDRRRDFKTGFSSEGARNKRVENRVMIRKNKRDESLRKKRNFGVSSQADSPSKPELSGTTAQKLEMLPRFTAMVASSDPAEQLEGTTQIRKLLSIERNPPIDEVIQTGIIPRLVQFLQNGTNPKLQLEAAWALTNVASGTTDNTRIVVESNAVPSFVQLLTSPFDDVREQAIWALGNIAGESPECRDYVLRHGALPAILQNIMSSPSASMLRNSTWCVSNLCRGKPEPPFDLVSPALPTLARLLQSTDKDVLADALWALSYLSDGENDKVQAVIDTGVARKLVDLLAHASQAVITPALRTLGNLVTGDDSQTQAVLDCHCLPRFFNLLNTGKKGIKKETCWALSNITAGSKRQIQAVIDSNIMPRLIHLLADAEYDVKKEAAWAIANATSGGTKEHIAYLVERGCIKPLCDLLGSADARIITVALDALENILKAGKKQQELNKFGFVSTKSYADLVEEADGLEKLESLQVHQNVDIYEKAVRILETYFEAEAEDENIAPNINSTPTGQQTFAFGFQPPPSGGAAPSGGAPGGGGFNFNF